MLYDIGNNVVKESTTENINEYVQAVVASIGIVQEIEQPIPETNVITALEYIKPELVEKIQQENQEVIDKYSFYLQFSAYELLFILNASELDYDSYVAIMKYKGLANLIDNPKFIHFKIFGTPSYEGKEIDKILAPYWNLDFAGFQYSSDDILSIQEKYGNDTIESISEQVHKIFNKMPHIEAIYILIKLGIWNYSEYHEFTGFSKPEKATPAEVIGLVAEGIGGAIGDALSFITESIVAPVLSGIFEGLFGKEWLFWLIFIIIIIIVILILIFVGYRYITSYISTKARKRAEK